jgi:hypothetical protein
MSRLVQFAEAWFRYWQSTDPGLDRRRVCGLPGRPARRRRPKTTLTLESVEPRVLLSTTHSALQAAPAIVDPRSVTVAPLAHPVASPIAGTATAHVPIKKALRVELTGISASGVEGGSATITARLTASGAPMSGQTVRFQIRGHNVGKATTDANGVATLSIAGIKGMRSGTYARGVTAVFSGDAIHKSSTSQGALTVSRFATGLGDVAAAGVYGGSGLLTATLNANGAPVAGQAIRFQLGGQDVGVASTNAQGVATLGNVSLAGRNAGANAGAVTASFAGTTAYQKNVASGTLTVGLAQTTVDLGGLTQTYDRTAKAATVTTGAPGLAYTLVYTDASGNPVTSPEAAGNYNVRVTITDPNYNGGATGQLVIAPARLGVSGITASAKAYDGTIVAALGTSGASLSGVVAGDDVTLDTTGATGDFDSRNVGAGKTVTIAGLTLTGADAANYVLGQPTTATADITAAPLTVTGIAASNKVYDGTTAATLETSGAELVDVVPGNDVILDVSGAIGTFDTSDVGTDKTVVITGLVLTGNDAPNYTLIDPTTTASIT